MPLDISTLYGFLLVLARVSGAFAFVPLPGQRNSIEPARAILALGITLALFPKWPAVPAAGASPGAVVLWLIAEAGVGLTIGVAAAFLLESFLVAAQAIGLQAGYAYASTVDPTTQADSGILLVLAQLVSGMLFFSLGLDREILRALAGSLDAWPPGAFWLSRPAAEVIARLGAGMLATGLRMAMPVLALLILVDLALALLGRLNAQLQLLSLAFPAKMLAATGLLAWSSVLFPKVYQGLAGAVMAGINGALGQPLAAPVR